jgi:predicted ribosome-associated RNA-binding protein Tma20
MRIFDCTSTILIRPAENPVATTICANGFCDETFNLIGVDAELLAFFTKYAPSLRLAKKSSS